MPSFASHEYWNTRFINDDSQFDWLIPAELLRDIIKERTPDSELSQKTILHVGCGTADSTVLKQLVESPSQIHNVDYSKAAIDAAAAREKTASETGEPKGHEKHDSVVDPQSIDRNLMRWSCLDLLSLHSTFSLLETQPEEGRLYDLVVDKSTSDSIACGDDVSIRLPYLLSINGWTRGILQSGYIQTVQIHPLHILAVHLAAVTKPSTGKWICISYSDERFPFLPPYPQSASHGFLPESVIRAGFTHPSQLWVLEAKAKIGSRNEHDETLAERKKRLSTGAVHRPQTPHWLYVLRRTDTLVTD